MVAKFNFYQNDELILNVDNLKLDYNPKIKEISFKIEDFAHKINLDENKLYFERKNTEYLFNINFKRKIAFLKLNNYNEFDIKVISCKINYNQKEIDILYKLESDEEKLNHLKFELKEGNL